MRRAFTVLAGLILLIAASVVPVAADTTGGGNQLNSSSTPTCNGDVCTQTLVSAVLDPSGGSFACIDFITYLPEDGTVVSDEVGCAPAPSFRISSTLAASFGPTSIPLEFCDPTCAPTRTVVVSASDTPTGPVSTTSGHTTTKDGTCTTKTKFTDSSVSVAGTFTVDGITTAETGDVSTHTEKSKTTCRS